jgi:DNA polymerase-4
MANTPPDTWIAHVDLDAFFASCEQRDNPEFRGKPVVVGALPGGRGVVAAASYEARTYGIHSAMPISEAYRRCPDAVFIRPEMSKYSAASKQVFSLLESISPVIEQASIDEAYIDISGLEKLMGTPEKIGQQIRASIVAATGLTASVGIGPNRLIAKLASDYDKPDGLTIVTPEQVAGFLAPLPIKVLRGAGKETQKVFAELGISTIEQLRTFNTRALREHLGAHSSENFLRQANGIASAVVSTKRQRKSISKERTFAQDVTARVHLRETLYELSRQVAGSARKKKLAGRVIKLKVRYSGFETYTRQTTLSSPCNDERVLREQAWNLFCQSNLPDKPVRLIGVGLSAWGASSAQPMQDDLFSASNDSSGSAAPTQLLDALDKINNRYGDQGIQLGMRRQHTSKKPSDQT